MKKNQKVALLCWFYNTDKWYKIKHLLEPIKDHVSLFCGLFYDTCSEKDYDDISKFCNDTSGELQYFDNVGADVNSFLFQISNIDKDKYPLFVKMHSKTNPLTLRYNIPWFSYLIDSLIGSPEIFHSNIERLENDPKCGMIGDPMIHLKDFEHTNTSKIQKILKHLDIDVSDIKNKEFIGGNMFASRTDIFQKYFDKNFYDYIYNHFLEALNTDKVGDKDFGTYPHALERIFGYIIEYNNLTIQHPLKKNIYSVKDPKLNVVRLYDNLVYLEDFPLLWGEMTETAEELCYIYWKQGTTKQIQKFRLKEKILEHYV